MKCPNCFTDQDHRVLDTNKKGFEIRRKRECKWCGYRFTTVERIYMPEGIEDKG